MPSHLTRDSWSPSTGDVAASPRRRRIAVLIDNIDHVSGGYEPQLRAAFDAACQARDLELVIVVGRPFDDPEPASAVQNRIFDLLTATSADGVIFLAAGLAAFSGTGRLAELHERLSPMVACSIGAEVPGVPSVLVDNRPGMDRLFDHVIGVHGRRRVAFIAGAPKNPDAEARLHAYRDALARHHIPYDPRLVGYGNFNTPAGARVALEILDGGASFDALVVSNDAMALSAIEALKGRGLRIPRDIAVTGFDDLVLARLASPPLTSVRQPLERMGALAVELIVEQLSGRPVPARLFLPVEFVVRESCGCSSRLIGPAPPTASTSGGPRVLDRDALARSVAEHALEPIDGSSAWIARLIEGIEVELAGTTGEFLFVLQDVLDEIGNLDAVCEKLQRAVEALRDALLVPELDASWVAARGAIDAATARHQARERLAIDVVFQGLLHSAERLATASLEPERLPQVIAEEMLRMRHKNVAISLYADERQVELSPLLWLHEGRAVEPETAFFAASELIPPEARDRRRSWFVLPLTVELEQLGVAAFELGPGVVMYEMLRGQISTALKTAALHREIVRTTKLHERSVQERLATAERMNSLSVLAGGVAHDLNNALGPLVMLPDMILGQIEDLRSGRLTDDSDLLLDVRTIKSSASRAAQTIKDLLLIGRPGPTAKEPLELGRAVSRCLDGEPLRFLMRGRLGLSIKLELDPEPLSIMGSEAHIGRALTNLVRNAAEAIPNEGEVHVTTERVILAEPLFGAEAIPPGDYAVVRVSDSGAGIATADISRIFQPFFSRKQRSDQSGSGLGLAIVHGVVKEHGGFIHVDSELGRGTTFSLYFQRVSLLVRRASDRATSPRGSARILLVDDEPAQLHSARRLLAQLGYEVNTLESGEEAFRVFYAARQAGAALGPARGPTPYDLVILDYALNEEHDGLETLERIRTLYPWQRGIMVSGHGREKPEGGSHAGRVPWLAKPYSADALAGIVRATLDAPGQ